MDIEQFRIDFAEFSDETKYPEPLVVFWSGIGEKLLNTNRWGDLLEQGLCLYTAHQLVLARKNLNAVEAGSDPGVDTGIISQQSAGSVSFGVDVQSSAENEGGFWNETVYGRQYLRLAKIIGIGGAIV